MAVPSYKENSAALSVPNARKHYVSFSFSPVGSVYVAVNVVMSPFWERVACFYLCLNSASDRFGERPLPTSIATP